ncbi:MAG TPA: hypothetical protein VNF68_01815 [Candidatus Baltobacteraceae bacterium]|nr:hypothetical protein [Candidatus Baltobacteraceae bacterium]
MLGPLVLAAALGAGAFAYDASAPLATRYGACSQRDGLRVCAIDFTSSAGRRIDGLLVRGRGNAPHPAVLFVHWLGDPKTTNHTEFENDAIALGKRGVTSLLIDAMWSQPEWFDKIRGPETDYADSIAQVVDLRRSLDELLAQPGIDRARVAYVGHDFGAMYGAILAGVDARPQWFVLMAGTTTLSEWYLLGKNPPDVKAYISQMEPLDPPAYLARSSARGFYFQFASHDRYITSEHERAFYDAAPLPRTMALYDADHSLATPEASADRLAWLAEKLQL